MNDREDLRAALADPRQLGDSWAAIAARLDAAQLQRHPDRVLGRLIPRAVVAGEDPYAARFADPDTLAQITVAAAALAKLGADPATALSDGEVAALVVLAHIAGRPAIPSRGGALVTPPPQWLDLLNDARDPIELRLASVGRIDAPSGTQIGTGFVIGDGLVMTNRHVAAVLHPHLRPVIDFGRELDGGTRQVEIVERLFLSKDPDLDLALLRIADRDASGAPLPPPLKLLPQPPRTVRDHLVYSIGYPGNDNGQVTPPAVLTSVFRGELGVKRVQPGLIRRLDDTGRSWFEHDCSTLGGSSGSCVFDYETQLVCGLHFAGRYRHWNRAVALWTLVDHPELRNRVVYG